MKEFLEKRWWQGVGGIAGIIALVLVVLQFRGIVNISGLAASIALNIIFAITLVLVAIWTTKLKRKYKDVSGRLEKSEEIIQSLTKKPQQQRVLLPDKNEIWRLNIDNALLTELHGQAHGLTITKFQDVKLASLSIIVNPYMQDDRVTILFTFYSRWADRVCTYILSEVGDIKQSAVPSEPARYDTDRVIFDELPWIRDPNWPQFLRKTCEKVGPLSPARWTQYHISALAYLEIQWSINFKDGVTGKEFRFLWDGKGEPITEE